jgi:hypothetical protein
MLSQKSLLLVLWVLVSYCQADTHGLNSLQRVY